MADTKVEAAISGATEASSALWGPYWTSPSIGALISMDSQHDLSAYRTTDSGANWTQVEAEAGTAGHVAAFFDGEVPSDAGDNIHVAWIEEGGTFRYGNFDIGSGAWGTIQTIASGTVDGANANTRCFIAKNVAGNLMAGWWANATGPVTGTWTSSDGFATPSAVTNAYEDDRDKILGFPASTADNEDFALLFWDISANAITIKMYDDSANTYTESAVASATDRATYREWDGAVRHSDSHILLAYHSIPDNSGDDLNTVDITPDSIASPTVTAKTAIFSNQAESGWATIMINQQNDDVYVAYLKGNPTLMATASAVYHLSSDGMGSWGGETAMSEDAADDHRELSSASSVGDNGGRWMPAWFDDDNTEIFVSETNDVAIAAVGGAVDPIALHIQIPNTVQMFPTRDLILRLFERLLPRRLHA